MRIEYITRDGMHFSNELDAKLHDALISFGYFTENQEKRASEMAQFLKENADLVREVLSDCGRIPFSGRGGGFNREGLYSDGGSPQEQKDLVALEPLPEKIIPFDFKLFIDGGYEAITRAGEVFSNAKVTGNPSYPLAAAHIGSNEVRYFTKDGFFNLGRRLSPLDLVKLRKIS